MTYKAKNCTGNCLACGKCGNFPILDRFTLTSRKFEHHNGYGIAVDLGTTNVVLALLNLNNGKIIARHSFQNPQCAFGADVISRIDAANNGSLENMRKKITESLVSGIETLMHSHSLKIIKDIVIAGNTVMTYLLLGLSCESLGMFPFEPVHSLTNEYDSSNVLGLSELECPVRIVPWISAFVGGDVTAGLLYVLPEDKSCFLLIDLGTNGEIALYDNGKLTVTSTAAGPAFDGNAPDVLDRMALLIHNDFIDETGLLADNAPAILTQKEIRSLQLAKSAVRSSLEILLESTGAEPDAVYLAGGIGQNLSADSAVTVGLLPGRLKDRVCAVGNASLGGAARMLLEPIKASTEMQALLTHASTLDLAGHPQFNDLFIENINFY